MYFKIKKNQNQYYYKKTTNPLDTFKTNVKINITGDIYINESEKIKFFPNHECKILLVAKVSLLENYIKHSNFMYIWKRESKALEISYFT